MIKDMLPNLNGGLQFLNAELKMEKYSAYFLSLLCSL